MMNNHIIEIEKLAARMAMFAVMILCCSLILGCEGDYEGLEIEYSAFMEMEETEYVVTLQKDRAREKELDVDVKIGIIPGVQVRSARFTVTFDPELVTLVGFKESEYYGGAGTINTGMDLDEAGSGIIDINISMLEGGQPPIDAFGEIIELHFEALRYIEDEAERGRCKDYVRDANFSYIDMIEGELYDMNDRYISGISWYGGVFCIFETE